MQQLSGGDQPDAAQLAAAQQSARSAELRRSSITPPGSIWQRGVAAVEQAWRRGGEAFSSLVDSVIRHESAGNVAAVSPKGARGLMQLMPETAREMAAKLGIHFDEQRLTADGEYNKRLGSAYLNEMLERYDGHQALALAAYNAGPGKVDEWLRSHGDPRSGEIGTEEWVRRIPYAETRNYTCNILRDLDMKIGSESRPVQGIELRAGERLSALTPAALNESAEAVAYRQNNSADSQAGRHQSLSAAFAQPLRLDSKGQMS